MSLFQSPYILICILSIYIEIRKNNGKKREGFVSRPEFALLVSVCIALHVIVLPSHGTRHCTARWRTMNSADVRQDRQIHNITGVSLIRVRNPGFFEKGGFLNRIILNYISESGPRDKTNAEPPFSEKGGVEDKLIVKPRFF